MTDRATSSPTTMQRFVHEALLYPGDPSFVAATAPLIAEAVGAGEAVMVAVDAAKIARLQAALGALSVDVRFVEMRALGRNPGRIIPAWLDFMAEQAATGRRALGIGEPVWPGRSPAEMVECERHESLLNLAFDGGPPWRLVCPYDTAALAPAVIERAACTHRSYAQQSPDGPAISYEEPQAAFEVPFPAPTGPVTEIALGLDGLHAARRMVIQLALGAGLARRVAGDLALAVNEVLANSFDHGDGRPTLRAWPDGPGVVCEVSDAGTITDPLAGRRRPTADQRRGRGLWLVHQLCDLVELRTGPSGTVVRLHADDRL